MHCSLTWVSLIYSDMNLDLFKTVVALLFFAGAATSLTAERIYDYNWQGFYNQGMEHYKFERYDNAIYYFEKARNIINRQFKKIPKDAWRVYTAEAMSLEKLGRRYDARDYYEKTLQLKPGQEVAHLFLARFYNTRRNYTEAEKHYRGYTDKIGDNPQMNIEYAVVLSRNAKHTEAHEYLKKISRSTTLPEKECSQLEQQSQFKKAHECYEKTVYLNPASQKLYYAMIRTASADSSIGENRRELWASRLFYLFEKDSRAAWSLFHVYYSEKKLSKAAEVLMHLKKLNPEDDLVPFWQSQIMLESGNPEQAEKYMNEARILRKQAQKS